MPKHSFDDSHVFHLFVVRVANRDDFISFLSANGVGSLIHYPVPPHKQNAFHEYKNLSLPITEHYHNTVVSIPLYPSLSDSNIQHIIDTVNSY
mgnify:FL=1